MQKIKLKSGGFEWVDTEVEKENKKKYKAKKKPADLTTKDIQELVYKLSKLARLI